MEQGKMKKKKEKKKRKKEMFINQSWSFSLNHGFKSRSNSLFERMVSSNVSLKIGCTTSQFHTDTAVKAHCNVLLNVPISLSFLKSEPSPNICFSLHVFHQSIIFFRHFIRLTLDSDVLHCFGNFRKDFRKHPSVPVRTVPQNRTGTLY